MKPSTDVFDLINALTPTEKRYFRVNAQRNSDTESVPNFLRLFDVISQQTDYDESAVKQAFLGEGIARNLPSEKNYLYGQILRSMRAFHEGNGCDSKLQVMVEELEFLFERKLYGQCKKMLLRAIQYAEHFDRFLVLIRLVDFEVRLHKILAKSGMVPAMVALDERRRQLMNRLAIDMEIASAYDQLYAYAVTDFLPGKKVDHPAFLILSDYAHDSESYQLLSFHRKILLWAALALEAQLKGLPERVRMCWENAVQVFENFPHQIEDDPVTYIKTLANLLAGYHHNQDYAGYPEVLHKMRNIRNKAFSVELALFLNADYYELLYCLVISNWERGRKLAASVEMKLELFAHQTPDSTRMAFWYNLGVLYFFSGKHRKALSCFREILDSIRTDIRTDLQMAAEWMFLLVHLENGNRDFIENHRRNFQRSLKRKDGRFKFEEIMLEFLKSYVQSLPGEEILVYQKLAHHLGEITEQRSVMVRSGFFEVKRWLDSKL